MRGRFVGIGASPFLAQAQTSFNRLDSLTIPEIQNRILISPPVQRLQAALSNARTPVRFNESPDPVLDIFRTLGIHLPDISDDAKATLAAILLDPSSDELADLTIIDGFFSVADQNQYRAQPALTPAVCSVLKSNRSGNIFTQGSNYDYNARQNIQVTTAGAVVGWLTYAPFNPRAITEGAPVHASQDEIDAIKNSDFFCGTPKSYPDMEIWSPKGDYAAWFGIDPNQPWGNIKLQVKNAITVMNVVASFPFPPPIDLYTPQFWATALGDIQTMIKVGAPLDPEVVGYWVTMSVLANYSGMVDRITADLKRANKKAKRKALIAMIGITIAGIVVSFLVPGIIAVAISLIKTAVETYIAIEQRKKAAREMVDAAKMFEADAPAFSAQVQKTADMLDATSAEQQANQPLTPDQQAAVKEVKANTPNSTGTVLAVGGGVAVVGVALFALLRR
jgi:hypothetical protein